MLCYVGIIKGNQQKGNTNYFLFAISFNNMLEKEKKKRTSEIQPR
jgi:hypothetical protein